MKITNTQKGPRGVNTLEGAVLVDPGQTVEVKLSDAELKVAKATGWFSFDGKAAKDELGGADAKSAADVLAMADGNFMAFKSAAAKLLGDKTPDKKADIVSALEELATQP
ncbi:MAG: hypothetical protein EOS71_00520 [Mesorhizobium sp.]|nr:hypothetical protein EOA35_00680 [Mesorhizobium sp. M8A.F.Ca.ET.023.01.1.1]RWC78466.1 MAG: hypothetical protein EOS71_00520 [Mesorhizobium sp.]